MQQPLLKYLALLAFFLPALSLATTALVPVEFALIEPVVKSLAVRQDGDIDIDVSGLVDLLKPLFDLLNPTTFENIATILRNAAALLSDENTELLVSVVVMLGDILTPELIDMVKDLLDAAKVIFGNLGQIINAVLRWLFGGSGGDDGGDDGDDDGGDDGGDDGDSGGIDWPDLGGDDDNDGGDNDGGSNPPDNSDGGDGGDDGGGFDWDFGGGDDSGNDGGSDGDDSSGAPDGGDSSGGDDGLDGDDSSGDTGGDDGGDNAPAFEGAGVRADPVAAASFAIFAGALGVMMAL